MFFFFVHRSFSFYYSTKKLTHTFYSFSLCGSNVFIFSFQLFVFLFVFLRSSVVHWLVFRYYIQHFFLVLFLFIRFSFVSLSATTLFSSELVTTCETSVTHGTTARNAHIFSCFLFRFFFLLPHSRLPSGATERILSNVRWNGKEINTVSWMFFFIISSFVSMYLFRSTFHSYSFHFVWNPFIRSTSMCVCPQELKFFPKKR